MRSLRNAHVSRGRVHSGHLGPYPVRVRRSSTGCVIWWLLGTARPPRRISGFALLPSDVWLVGWMPRKGEVAISGLSENPRWFSVVIFLLWRSPQVSPQTCQEPQTAALVTGNRTGPRRVQSAPSGHSPSGDVHEYSATNDGMGVARWQDHRSVIAPSSSRWNFPLDPVLPATARTADSSTSTPRPGASGMAR